MLPRPACRRAVQHQFLSPTESIWISDEAVHQAFQHFARGSKVGRRYGSFVPGPMESRRRLGKRRMTLQSDASPMPVFSPGIFQGWFGERDRAQWQWEAPSTRPSNFEAVEQALPSWLLEWATLPKNTAEVPVVKNHTRDRRKKLTFRIEEVTAFSTELENYSGDRSMVCNAFIRKIKQNLSLGIMSEGNLQHVLKAVPEVIMHQDFNSTEAHSHCLRLYQAVWEGIESCKVLQAGALHGKTLNRIVNLICQLPMTIESRELGARIVRAASSTQLPYLKDGIDRFVVTWIRTLLQATPPTTADDSLWEATEAVEEVNKKIEDIQQLRSAALSTGRSTGILERIYEARTSIGLAMEKVQNGEHAINPVQAPTMALVKLLGHLPDAMVRSILRCSAHYIAKNAFGINDKTNDRLQRRFLSLVARVPAIGDLPFENILKSTTCSIGPSFFSSLVLHQWISQGYLKNAAAVRNTFEVTAHSTGQRDIATLLYAVDMHKEACWTRLRILIALFHTLGKQRTAHQTTVRMHEANIKIPADIMGPILESVSTFDARLALELYNLYFAMRINFMPLRPELCPSFVTAMINDPSIKPETIWKIIGVPVYESTPREKRFTFSKKKLTPELMGLINKMAVAFAHSNRPPRVAFRNVEQCLHHLRRHGAPITSDITRSIIHSGVTSKIKEGKWVSKGRTAWALGLVERAEGTQVAVIADSAVKYWNETISEERYRERRRRNPLQVGPID